MITLTQTPRPCWQGRSMAPPLPPAFHLLRYPVALWQRYKHWQDQRILNSLPMDLRKDLGWPAENEC